MRLSDQRYTELDALRGVAAFCVMLFHYQAFFSRRGGFFDWAYVCVDLFFIISGIVLTHTYERRILTGALDFRDFLVARLARMGPLHWAVLLFLVLADAVLSHWVPANGHIVAWHAPVYNFVLNLLLIQNVGLADGLYWNQAAWSISVEVFVNVLWFFLLQRWRPGPLGLSAIIFCSAAILFNAYSVHHGLRIGSTYETFYGVFNGGVLRCFIGFSLGILLYRYGLRQRRLIPVTHGLAWNIGALVLVAVMYVAFRAHDNPALAGIDYIAVFVFFPIFILAILFEGSWLGALLRQPLLLWLGERSYSIYLVHMPIGYMIPDLETLSGWHPAPPLKGLLFILLVLVVAELTYRSIERPCRRAIRQAWRRHHGEAYGVDGSQLR